MKTKKYTSLYLSESIVPILFFTALTVLEFVFFFRMLDKSTLSSFGDSQLGSHIEDAYVGRTVIPSELEQSEPGSSKSFNGYDITPSSLLDLFPVIFFIGGIVFVTLYMLLRFVTIDGNGVYYKHLKTEYFIPWEEINYVKITFNSNRFVGRGSYIILSKTPYTLQDTDFRASREDFIVLRYRRSAINTVKAYYDGEVIRASRT